MSMSCEYTCNVSNVRPGTVHQVSYDSQCRTVSGLNGICDVFVGAAAWRGYPRGQGVGAGVAF